MAYSVAGDLPSSKKGPVAALAIPFVLPADVTDETSGLNDINISGKQAGSQVYLVQSGTVEVPTSVTLLIASGGLPNDPWLQLEANPGDVEVSSSDISDAGAFGASMLRTATRAELMTLLQLVAADITDSTATGRNLLKATNVAAVQTLLGYLTASSTATATVKGPVLMASRQSGVTMNSTAASTSSATAQTASTATDVAGIVANFNTLVTSYNLLLASFNTLVDKYNVQRADTNSVNTNLNSVIVAEKAAGQMAS